MQVACVYRLIAPNGKVYIGQTWDFSRRYAEYRKHGARSQPKLGRSIRKYGFFAFQYDILLELPDADQPTLDRMESFWIRTYDACKEGLNVREGGSRGKHSAATCAKISAAHMGRVVSAETRAKLSASRMGMSLTAEHKEALTSSTRGKPWSEERKRALSEKTKARMTLEWRAGISARTKRQWAEGVKPKTRANHTEAPDAG